MWHAAEEARGGELARESSFHALMVKTQAALNSTSVIDVIWAA
jgi:hypothetical protein